MKKAQASFEYLSIISISLVIIIALGSIFFIYSDEAGNELEYKQSVKIGTEIISGIEKLYFLPEGNKQSFKANFPEGIYNMTIVHMNLSGKEFDLLNFTYDTEGNYNSKVFETSELYIRFNCSYSCNHDYTTNVSWFNESDFSQGTKKIQLVSMGSYVEIDFVR